MVREGFSEKVAVELRLTKNRQLCLEFEEAPLLNEEAAHPEVTILVCSQNRKQNGGTEQRE